jgi:glycosyltransferase involved in cell wall biosynthesis
MMELSPSPPIGPDGIPPTPVATAGSLDAAHSHAGQVADLVSVVMPCRNEERYIRECLDSILGNGYPLDRLELLVVDGESEDNSRAIVREYAQRYACVRLLENPRRIIPAALNVGIRAARGGVIMRMDAHATYAPGYIRGCVAALHEHGADNVGGVWVISPKRATPMADAIGVSLSHLFGVGDAQYRLGAGFPMDVDTVPFGCYRRNVFERIGYFDENLRRGEDMDFNLRLKAAGGRILLLPDVVCYYHPRATLPTFVRHNFWNGIWVFYPLRYGRLAFSLRHVIPGLFVATVLASLAAALIWPAVWIVLALVAGSYLLLSTVESVIIARARRRWYLAWLLPIVFASLHLTYGIGSLVGLVRAVVRRGFWRMVTASGDVGQAGESPPDMEARTLGEGTEAVTIIIPCRNEARYIRECLDSVLANGFPRERLEILVVDGESEDETRAIVAEYARRFPCVRLLRNPQRIVPTALNLGIRVARGQVIMRMDAHATYAGGYIERCVAALREHRADNVGGVWVISPKGSNPVAEAIAVTLSHPFGIGDAQYRLGVGRPMEVDTVPFGCYRRELFDRIGLFDENLRRGQDMEFNLRLRAAGGRILLVPGVVCHYHPRATLPTFLRHNFWNGVWVFYPMRFGRVAFTLRHVIPGLFVGLLLLTGATGVLWPRLWTVTLVTAGVYAMASLVSSLLVARARRRWYLGILLPVGFAALHLAYGMGTLVGVCRILGRREFWRRITELTVASARSPSGRDASGGAKA